MKMQSATLKELRECSLTQSQFQIIFGSGLVNLVCDEVQKQLGISVDTPADAEKEEKKEMFFRD